MSNVLEDNNSHNKIHAGMDSLEERVISVLFDEYSDEYNSDRCLEYDQIIFDGDDSHDPEERTLYWESQYSLLQEVLERYSLKGSKLRREINRTIDMAKGSVFCNCPNPKSDHGCNHCFRRTIVKTLREKGINANLCTSKWRDTKKFPRGSHEYVEVIGSTSNRKKQIPILVEVEFRDQFQIAKSCEEYRRLLSLLPEYYIGKPDYINAVVRIVCEAAKRSMKERKIHMGPWRKTSFMLMKWSASIDKLTLTDSSTEKFRQLSPPPNQSRFSTAPPAVVVT